MAVADEPRLGCGRPIDEVWARIGLPPDEHEAQCADCQKARESVGRLSLLTEQLRDADENDPELSPGPQLKNSIMDLARAEVRRGRMLPLRRPEVPTEDPDLTISEQAVAAIVRAAADTIPQLHARRCHVRIGEVIPSSSSAEVAVLVDLTAAGVGGGSGADGDRELRRRVSERVAAETGLVVERLDVRVEDLFDV